MARKTLTLAPVSPAVTDKEVTGATKRAVSPPPAKVHALVPTKLPAAQFSPGQCSSTPAKRLASIRLPHGSVPNPDAMEPELELETSTPRPDQTTSRLVSPVAARFKSPVPPAQFSPGLFMKSLDGQPVDSSSLGDGDSGSVFNRVRRAVDLEKPLNKEWTISHGCLTFTGESANRRDMLDSDARTFEKAQQAKFLKISGAEDLAKSFTSMTDPIARQRRVKQLLAVVGVIEKEWKMSMPPMILSVTGNAAPFEMRPKFHEIFKQALVSATKSTSAWVITGGTDAGVMRLVGDAMKNSSSIVLGISSWGVIKGRVRLNRPSSKSIATRIQEQVRLKSVGSPRSAADESQFRTTLAEVVPTHMHVTEQYTQRKGRGWADPEQPPSNIDARTSFLGGSHGSTVGQLGLIGRDGRPDITLAFPDLSTGRRGRGSLGRWGPNQAFDTIVTKRLIGDVERNQGASTGLQVALMFRETDQVRSYSFYWHSRPVECEAAM
jgi:hypothetical protein